MWYHPRGMCFPPKIPSFARRCRLFVLVAQIRWNGRGVIRAKRGYEYENFPGAASGVTADGAFLLEEEGVKEMTCMLVLEIELL